MKYRSFHPLDDQLRDPVAAPEADRAVPVCIHQGHLDLTAVAGVDRSRRVHQCYPVPGRQARAGMHERRVPVGQRDRQPGPYQRPLAWSKLDVFSRRQVRARVARMGVRRQRNSGIDALDQYIGLGMRQRRLPNCLHAR